VDDGCHEKQFSVSLLVLFTMGKVWEVRADLMDPYLFLMSSLAWLLNGGMALMASRDNDIRHTPS
jgi:hypothetical protein